MSYFNKGKMFIRLLSIFHNLLRVKVLRDVDWRFLASCYPSLVNLARWNKIEEDDFFGLRNFIVGGIGKSYAQLQQDLVAQFIYLQSKELDASKLPPYFVEIGANDGIYLSNTYTLERNFGWRGLLSEASPTLIQQLRKNRNNCAIDERAVTRWSDLELPFMTTQNSEYSALKGSSVHREQFRNAVEVSVISVNLTDLLIEQKTPSVIDFLSIDTEGNEYEILLGLDFGKFTFNFISVESSKDSDQISQCLASNGYTQILNNISLWDQWWINTNLLEKFEKKSRMQTKI
jgi:FkbM family methyltransferase